MLPDGRSALGLHGGAVRPGSVGGYWQATAPGGRDVTGKGRQVYPDFNRGYPYQVSGVLLVSVLVLVCRYACLRICMVFFFVFCHDFLDGGRWYCGRWCDAIVLWACVVEMPLPRVVVD